TGRACGREKEEACTRRALRRRWLHRKGLRPFGYRLLNEAAGRHTVCFNVQIGRAGKRGGLGKRLCREARAKQGRSRLTGRLRRYHCGAVSFKSQKRGVQA